MILKLPSYWRGLDKLILVETSLNVDEKKLSNFLNQLTFMPINPNNVIYPQNRIRRVLRVLHDGTQNPPHEFSLAEIELQDDSVCFGIRHNMNEWNEENPDLGYPTCRPGNPTWFILPDIADLLPVLNNLFGNPNA